jgi:ATP-dependent DNA ligase
MPSHKDRQVASGDPWLHEINTMASGVSLAKRLGSRYRSGRSTDWLKFKNPAAPAVKREAEEDWGR